MEKDRSVSIPCKIIEKSVVEMFDKKYHVSWDYYWYIFAQDEK